MITPPTKLTLQISKSLGLTAAVLVFVAPIPSALVALAALVLLVLGCELKGL